MLLGKETPRKVKSAVVWRELVSRSTRATHGVKSRLQRPSSVASCSIPVGRVPLIEISTFSPIQRCQMRPCRRQCRHSESAPQATRCTADVDEGLAPEIGSGSHPTAALPAPAAEEQRVRIHCLDLDRFNLFIPATSLQHTIPSYLRYLSTLVISVSCSFPVYSASRGSGERTKRIITARISKRGRQRSS